MYSLLYILTVTSKQEDQTRLWTVELCPTCSHVSQEKLTKARHMEDIEFYCWLLFLSFLSCCENIFWNNHSHKRQKRSQNRMQRRTSLNFTALQNSEVSFTFFTFWRWQHLAVKETDILLELVETKQQSNISIYWMCLPNDVIHEILTFINYNT